MTEMVIALAVPLLLAAMLLGFVSMMSAKYVDEYFERHAREFGGGLFFTGPYEKFGYERDARPSDVRNFVGRKDGQGNPTRRVQKGNQTTLYTETPSLHPSVTYRLQEYFADLPAHEAREKVTGFMREVFEVMEGHKCPVPEYVRRGGGGKTLVPAQSVELVAMHLHTYDGEFGPHIHKAWNGVNWGADGRPGTSPENAVRWEIAKFKAVAWQAAVVEVGKKRGWDLQLSDGRAADLSVDPSLWRDAGIGAKREKIVKWVAKRGWTLSRFSTFIANMELRETPRKNFTLEERARHWGEGVRRARERLRQREQGAEQPWEWVTKPKAQEATKTQQPKNDRPLAWDQEPPPVSPQQKKPQEPKKERPLSWDHEPVGQEKQQKKEEKPQPRQMPKWDTVPPDTVLKAHDVKPANYGRVVEDLGDQVLMLFVSKEGRVARVAIGKDKLTYPDGKTLAFLPDPTRGPSGPQQWTSPTQAAHAGPAQPQQPQQAPAQGPQQAQQRPPQPQAQVPTRGARDPLARAYHDAARTVEWLFLRMRYRKEQTILIPDRATLDRFIADTKRRPAYEGIRAARRKMREEGRLGTPVFDAVQCFTIGLPAYFKGRRPRHRTTKNHRYVIHSSVHPQMTHKDFLHLEALVKKRGCAIEVRGLSAEQLRERLSEAHSAQRRRPPHRQRGAAIHYRA